MANGGGASFSPTHAATFEAVVDQCFAGRLDHAGADQPAVGNVLRVIRAMPVVPQVAGQLAMSFADFGRTIRQVEGFQLAERLGLA